MFNQCNEIQNRNKDYHDVFLGHVLFLGNLRKAQLKFVEAYVRLILYKYEITT